KVSDVVNLIAQVNISKGTVITSDMLVRDAGLITTSNAPAYLPLAQGYVAMAIPTGEQQGVAGHITVGDYITMIAAAQLTLFNKAGQQQGAPQTVIKTVFTNVRVIQVGPAQINVQPAAGANASTSNQGQVGGVTSSLTIEVTQCDAELIQWFQSNTVQLKYTLESFHDYQPAPARPDPACPTIPAPKAVTASAAGGFTTASAIPVARPVAPVPSAPPAPRPAAGGEQLPAFTAAKVQIHAKLIEKFADQIDSSNKEGVRAKIVELADEYF